MLLSICMPTLNRAAFIGETLDSILPQLGDNMEVVVVDGGSGDGTADVVRQRTEKCDRIRYYLSQHVAEGAPKPSNAGYDRDCDYSVQLARGKYCWLLPDDDPLVPDALARLEKQLNTGVVLVVANSEVRSKDLSRRFVEQRLVLSEDVTFAKGEAGRLLSAVGRYLSYAGGVVVRRDWWLSRNRERYYGSGFVHVATLFQDPSDLDAVVIARPLILQRYGNALWTGRAFMIWTFQWPELVWSLPVEEKSKRDVTPREPWRHLPMLALFRARGNFSWNEYRILVEKASPPWSSRLVASIIAAFPGFILNGLALLALCVIGKRKSWTFVDLWHSKYNLLGSLPPPLGKG